MAAAPPPSTSRKSAARELILKSALIVGVAIGLSLVGYFLTLTGVIPPGAATVLFNLAIVLLGGFFLTRFLSRFVRRFGWPSVGNAIAVSNIIKVVGYTVTVFAALAVFGVSPELILASGAFAGIVVGLGLQPVLVNFFAGLTLILGHYVSPGDDVSLLSSYMGLSSAAHPHYSFASRDYLDHGYRGKIVDVGLMFSTIVTPEGLEVRLSNGLLLNAAIVDHRQGIYHVRAEFRNDPSPDTTMSKVREALSDMDGIVEVAIDETADEDSYFIVVFFKPQSAEKARTMKSDILKNLLQVQRELQRGVKP